MVRQNPATSDGWRGRLGRVGIAFLLTAGLLPGLGGGEVPRAAEPAVEPPGRTVLKVDSFQQTTSYTCGPACLITLQRFHGRTGEELPIAREAGCTPEKGTSPAGMVRWLKAHDYDVEWGENGTLALLRENLRQGLPTLVEWIDWGGHWVLVVGYDTRGTETERDDLLIFADPADSLDGERDGLTSFHAPRFVAMWFDAFLFERPMHKVYITPRPKRAGPEPSDRSR